MPMRFSLYESWLGEDGNSIPIREGRRVSTERHRRRYSTSATSTKVQIVLPPTPEPQPQIQEVCYIPAFLPAPAPAPVYNPTFSIEATAAEIASRIVAENVAKEELSSLQARLEEEQALRLKAEHERGREEARRITQEIDASRRSRELISREDDARRRIAEEYRHHQSRSCGNSPRASGESLWSTTPRASSSVTDRLVVVHHSSQQRSHSDSRSHRCSACGHGGHRSRDCHYTIEPAGHRTSRRVRYLDSGL